MEILVKVNPVIESIKIESQQLDPYEGKEKEGFIPKNSTKLNHTWTIQTYEKKFRLLSQIAYGVLAALGTLTTLCFGLLIKPIQDLWKNAITGKKLYRVEKERKAHEIKTDVASKHILPGREKQTEVSKHSTISQDSLKHPVLDLAMQKQANQQQLMHALNTGDMRMLAHLMDQPLETLKGLKRADGTTVLHLCVESGDKILVEKALKHGAEIEALRSGLRSYENAFHLAILHGFIDIIDLLDQHDKNRDDYHDTNAVLHRQFASFSPLILALREDLLTQVRAHSTSFPRSHPFDVAARLLVLGADPGVFFEGTKTFFALKQAVHFKDITGREHQHVDLLKAFLQRGARDLPKVSKDGHKNNYFQSAIFQAVRNDLMEIVQLLVENDKEKKESFGIYDAIQSAKSKKMLELFIDLASNDGLLKLIREGLDANNNNLLHTLLQENLDFLIQRGIDLDLITFCLDLQISPIKENRQGRTALELALTLFNKTKNDSLKENLKEITRIFIKKIDLSGFNSLAFKQKYKFLTSDMEIQTWIDPLHEVGDQVESFIEI